MARYHTFGRLDSPQVTDGDNAFVRWVSRINPEQLQTGEVHYSQNGRMDNDRAWQPRKGINVFSPGLDITPGLNYTFNYNDSSPPTYDDSLINGVYGGGYMIDPASGIGYILLATNNKVFAINIDNPAVTNTGIAIYYPGVSIDAEVEMVQALDKVVLFRSGQRALELTKSLTGYSSDGINQADLNTTTAGSVWIETDNPHGLSVGDWITVADVGFTTTDPNGTYRIASVPAAQELTYVLAGGAEVFTTAGSPTYIEVPSFSLVSTTPTAVTVDYTASNAVVADGLVTVTATGHGRSTGDILTVYDAGDSGLVEGDRYEITVTGANNYTFNAEIADGTYGITLGGKQPISGGYIAMPNPEWGVLHEGRLIVPYQRTLSTGVSRDEIIFSDIFDTDTYDPILNQFRIASGGADYVLGVAPLLSNRLLVFCRRSIHLIDGVSGSLDDTSVTELTREVGCLARGTIIEVGGSVMFLSDQGVYSISYGQELNLIANAIPLSEPIENYMRLINWEYASDAVAAYADNRYYLAVPLGKSKVNNAIFVYNFLNQGWESVDTFPDGFDIFRLVVAPRNGRNRVFAMNRIGAVHITDDVDGYDIYEITAGTAEQNPVDGRLITRRYVMGTMDLKRFTRATSLVESPGTLFSTNLPDAYKPDSDDGQGGVMKVLVGIVDPDTSNPDFVEIDSIDVEDGEDYTLKSSIRKRGYGAQLSYETSTAKLRGCNIESTLSSLANVDRS